MPIESIPISTKTFDGAQQVKYALKRSLNAVPSDAILLSGGIDSSLIAALDPKLSAVTVVFEQQGWDLKHAQRVSEYLGMDWHPIVLNETDCLNELKELVSLVGSFDRAILNDIPVYVGLKYCASRGWKNVRTGDAADTLFAGYKYTHQLHDFNAYLNAVIPQLRMASSQVGKKMGIRLHYPYLAPEVLDVARSLTIEDNTIDIPTLGIGDFVENFNEDKPNRSNKWGKIPLRIAGLSYLPPEIVWRIKTDLEFGSGTYQLYKTLLKNYDVKDLDKADEENMCFWDEAHKSLYILFKELGLKIRQPNNNEYACHWCGGGVIIGRRHCFTCGGYPVDQKKNIEDKWIGS